ncbi:MAG: hypothetical protein HY698_00235 [Deltaproteobacteria bacterium]|nr:hypothetical protein [Deltaproteobacteria bacterium]
MKRNAMKVLQSAKTTGRATMSGLLALSTALLPSCDMGLEGDGFATQEIRNCDPGDCDPIGPRPPRPTPQPADKNVVLSNLNGTVSMTEWSDAVNKSFGVAAKDPLGQFVGTYPAWRYGKRNWNPLDSYKRTLCATLNDHKTYDGQGEEMDWNHFMLPTWAYKNLISDAERIVNQTVGLLPAVNEWHKCKVNTTGVPFSETCMETEVSPPGTFWKNEWFPVPDSDFWGDNTGDPKSPLEGKVVCTHGPWVREAWHDNRPEIHPSNLIWWNGNQGARGGIFDRPFLGDDYHREPHLMLMLMPDTSERFHDKGRYDISGTPPSNWRPWSQGPIAGEFRVAFKVPLDSTQVPTFYVHQLSARSVVANFSDADDGKTHGLEYQGKVLIRVIENQASDESVGVGFQVAGTSTTAYGTRYLHGFVVINAAVNLDGYHVIKVSKNATASASTTSFAVRATATPGTLRAVGKGQLVGDMNLEVVGGPSALAATPYVTETKLALPKGMRRLTLQPVLPGAAKEAIGSVPGVVMQKGAKLELSLMSGEKLGVPLPELGLAARVRVARGQETFDSTARALLMENKGLGLAKKLDVVATRKVTVHAVPLYGFLRNERDMEHGSPHLKQLNGIVERGDTKSLRALFGTDKPFSVKWSFEGLNALTGARVPVVVAASAPRAIRVDYVPSATSGESLQVTFPEQPGAIYELVATATVTDNKGNTGSAVHRVASHVVTVDTTLPAAQTLLPVAAEISGVNPDTLLAAAKLNDLSTDEIEDDYLRRARMARIFAEQVADGGRVDVRDFQGLVGLVKQFAGK